jgi:Cu/Ag efflux protein CusF
MKLAHILAAATVAMAASAHAQTDAGDHASHHPAAAASASAAPMTTEGEVRKVDREQGKVTLKHGPIENLGMPGMTMVFKVSDSKLLDIVKVGDKVKFAADSINGTLTVTAIEAAK